MPDAVASVAKIQIGRILAPALSFCLEIRLNLAPVDSSKGRTRCFALWAGAMPASPRVPVPRMIRISTVSA